MSGVAQIALPVPYLGTVNLWLLEGDPLTLVDTGPANAALAALEQRWRRTACALEDIELVLLTHHHLDHTGWPARSRGAREHGRGTRGTAAWARLPRAASRRAPLHAALIAEHGVPRT